ncbi:hypothetical protein [Paenibacillus silviterrae]|uniref:hypothetical protein n=1 Tax=Paenibacillus silviterrae TaxID=3242194 RepID=UPI002542AD10|nr:hypothetical protein [Paenibacillus chinjuensis]
MRMYIRHAVGGRLFLDSEKHQTAFDLSRSENGWTFTIDLAEEQLAEELMKNRLELNIFVVDEDRQNQKSWYYSSDGAITYNKEERKLIIAADARMDYNV